ncbi:MAG: response regulator transcription factor [Anaerolineales bacterium]|nr:response regulator transcription factor [Anaerolineales bacterium]
MQVISTCFEMLWPDSIIVSVSQGKKGIELVETESPDLVLLDIGLPDMDGFEVLRRIRFFSSVPTIIETVEDQEVDCIRGLELGADDYITKPFSYMELLARVKAVLRRSQLVEFKGGETNFVSGNLTINFTTREVRLGDEVIKLTPTEYRLLYLLVRNKGQVVTQRKLMQQVWGEDYIENTDYLRAYIRRLRDKLQDNPPQMILTEHGLGYRFANRS